MEILFLIMSSIIGVPVILFSRVMAKKMKQDMLDQRLFCKVDVTTIQVALILAGCAFMAFGYVAYKYL